MSRQQQQSTELVPRVPRCCARHDDWPTLARHVMDGFPDVDLPYIARELRLAKDVVDTFCAGDDGLEIAELIARHRLLLMSGGIVDSAKLDPQRRHGRRTPSG